MLAINSNKMYNTLMHRRTLLLTGTLTLLAVPLHAAAYLTPEQVLLQDTFLENFKEPPTARSTSEQVQWQNEVSAQRRAQEQAAYFAAQRSSSPTHAAAAAQGSSTSAGLNDVLQSLQQTIDALANSRAAPSDREQRILDRIAANQEAMHGTAPEDEMLHSGAPLTDTGPGTYLS